MDGALRTTDIPAGSERDAALPLRLLFVASEIYPMSKTGGLADVCAGLPQALAECGAEVRLLMPAYADALDQVVAPRVLVELDSVLEQQVRVIAARTPDTALPIWLVDSPALFRRRGGPYLDEQGREWDDNPLRFALFCQVAARLARDGDALTGWQADLVHCHDWHTGLLPLLLATGRQPAPRSVFTIHNAAFQGNCPLQEAPGLGVAPAALGPDGAEFYGQLSFLKAGIRYADRVTTVSPTYARELLTAEHGCGMDGVLRERGSDFSGILNGIDTALWNPAGDRHLPARYHAGEIAGKAVCKQALQAELGFELDPARPLAIMVSRLTGQKMADVVLDELPALLEAEPSLQFALLGCGERRIEQGFTALAAARPTQVAARIGYDEATAHRLHAGADLLLHGSRFEPCGLVQMYAMRYGTAPVASRVGGLADTVIDATDASDGTGFVFDQCDGGALRAAVQRGLDVRREQPATWRRLQANAMQRDFGWRASAREYLRLYGGLLNDGLVDGLVRPVQRQATAGARPAPAMAVATGCH
jgi:starch synthase